MLWLPNCGTCRCLFSLPLLFLKIVNAEDHHFPRKVLPVWLGDLWWRPIHSINGLEEKLPGRIDRFGKFVTENSFTMNPLIIGAIWNCLFGIRNR